MILRAFFYVTNLDQSPKGLSLSIDHTSSTDNILAGLEG